MHHLIKFWPNSDSGLFNLNRINRNFVSLQLTVQCIKFLIVSKAIKFPLPSGVHTKEMFKGSNIETKNNTFSMLRFKCFFYAFSIHWMLLEIHIRNLCASSAILDNIFGAINITVDQILNMLLFKFMFYWIVLAYT